MSETNAERLDLEKVKRYDDSWWLHYLKENTVFDAEGIKAHKDWLIEQAERVTELENDIEVMSMAAGDSENELVNSRLVNKLLTAERAGFKAENERLREALEFYADEAKYEKIENCDGETEIYIERDCGERARKELEGSE